MKYLSLFSGIGGFEKGIIQAYESNRNRRNTEESSVDVGTSTNSAVNERVGESPSCIGFSEIDKYATQIYQSHFPEHKNYGDITKINAKELPDFDLLVGGFPCQSFSIAGKRGGFDDTRGTLFFDIARILKEKQPRLFVLENVKGLLSHGAGSTFYTIISTLDELGYDLQWQVLNSKNFGVPQNRERVFIIGHLRGTSRPQVFPFGENDRTDNKSSELCDRRKLLQGNESGAIQEEETKTTSKPSGQIIRKDWNQPDNTDSRGGQTHTSYRIPEATKQGFAEAEEGDSINLSVPNSKTRRGRVGKGIAQTIDTGMQQHTIQDYKIRRLTPTECMRLQGFPDNWCDGISDTQKYKCAGNAVTVNVIEAIMEKLL